MGVGHRERLVDASLSLCEELLAVMLCVPQLPIDRDMGVERAKGFASSSRQSKNDVTVERLHQPKTTWAIADEDKSKVWKEVIISSGLVVGASLWLLQCSRMILVVRSAWNLRVCTAYVEVIDPTDSEVETWVVVMIGVKPSLEATA